MSEKQNTPEDRLHPIQDWFNKFKPSRLFAVALTLAAVTSAVATWLVITGSEGPFGDNDGTISILVMINLVLVIILLVVIGRRLISLYSAMKKGQVGSHLQTRIVLIFSLVTIFPTVIVSVFSALFFQFGIKSWFDERVQVALEESVTVAEAYLEEHKENIRADAVAMSNDLKRNLSFLMSTPGALPQALNTQAALRNLTDAIVFQPNRVLARSELSFALSFEQIPQHILEKANRGNVVILAGAGDDDKIQALVQIDELAQLYLIVGRIIDAKVLNHMAMSQGAVNEYKRLQTDISDFQIQFSLLFILVSLLLLLAAIWYGIYIAIRLVVPITQLITAAEKIRAGDFNTRVSIEDNDDEISTLGRTFNRMTSQLDKQRGELINANRQLDERRRFIEAVFAGVASGVIALAPDYVVTLSNRFAAQLLQDDDSQSLRGMPIMPLIPGIDELLKAVKDTPDELFSKNMILNRGQAKLNLNVRVTAEQKDGEIEGYIVTFEDITELEVAQRSAAWSDVARRIAHEIKNPLTPITLSTERLKRKYVEQLDNDEERESYLRYIDTIMRHVGDIGQMVEEFVSFARMPDAVMGEHDITRTAREAIFSAKTANPNITYNHSIPEVGIKLRYDERQISQVLTNLLKNAAEGLESKAEKEDDFEGQITLSIEEDEKRVHVIIEDNGIGFPPDKIANLTEPYVTTRAKGTGLGLAIVKKHMEEHKGSLTLENRAEGGARVKLSFSK